MIRTARPDDLPALGRIAEDADMFIGDELASFSAAVAEIVASAAPEALLVVSCGADDAALAAAMLAPERMAQGVMNLLFLGVRRPARRQRHGAALLGHAEAAARGRGARLMIVETAGDDQFAPARALYRAHGYDEEARVRDFYDDGLDKIILRKRL